jgi:hypothetical protein
MSKQRRSKNAIGRPSKQTLGPRPEEFPLGSPQSRAAARAVLLNNQKRVISVCAVGVGSLDIIKILHQNKLYPDNIARQNPRTKENRSVRERHTKLRLAFAPFPQLVDEHGIFGVAITEPEERIGCRLPPRRRVSTWFV